MSVGLPRGTRITRGYATVPGTHGGLDYRQIADIMTAEGDEMNHATARNVLIGAMKKFAGAVMEHYQVGYHKSVGHASNVDEIAAHPSFQDAVCTVLQDDLALKAMANEQ